MANFEVSVVSDGASGQSDRRPPVVLAVSGELDIATRPYLCLQLQTLLDAGEAQVVIDMGAVEFIDASGIGGLVDAARKARKAGGGIALRRPSRNVRRVLDVLQLDGALPVVGG